MELRRWISLGGIVWASFLMEDSACSRRRDCRENIVNAVMEEDASATNTRRAVGPLRRLTNESIADLSKISQNYKAGMSNLKRGGDLCRSLRQVIRFVQGTATLFNNLRAGGHDVSG